MPASGPTVSTIVDPDSARANTYVVIDLTPSILQKLQDIPAKDLASSFGDLQTVPPEHIGIGDTVSVSVWEAGAGGLFFNTGSAPANGQPAAAGPASGARFLTLPNQMVDLAGAVTVPYAGQVQVAGLTPTAAQDAIERALGKKALQPQVMVTVVQNQSSLVTVSGDVAQPGRVPLYLQGGRMLDIIAQAGGSKWPAYDTTVQLTRDGISRRVRLEQVLAHPGDNIPLQGGDLLHLIREPQTVAVLGATTTNALVPFDTERLTLAEALAKAGGLHDVQADAKGVFVFRFEPVDVVHALVPDTAGAALPPMTPVVYRADLQQASSLFLTETFPMHDKDLVYVANTDSVQLEKLILTVRDTALILSPAYFFTR